MREEGRTSGRMEERGHEWLGHVLVRDDVRVPETSSVAWTSTLYRQIDRNPSRGCARRCAPTTTRPRQPVCQLRASPKFCGSPRWDSHVDGTSATTSSTDEVVSIHRRTRRASAATRIALRACAPTQTTVEKKLPSSLPLSNPMHRRRSLGSFGSLARESIGTEPGCDSGSKGNEGRLHRSGFDATFHVAKSTTQRAAASERHVRGVGEGDGRLGRGGGLRVDVERRERMDRRSSGMPRVLTTRRRRRTGHTCRSINRTSKMANYINYRIKVTVTDGRQMVGRCVRNTMPVRV